MTDETLPPSGDEPTPPPSPKPEPFEIIGPLEDDAQKPRGQSILNPNKKHVCTPACKHGDSNDHHHDEPKRAPRPKLNGIGERWSEFKKNVDSRFNHSIDLTHTVTDDHGHTHAAPFTDNYKRGAILGATVSIGAIIHGGVNIVRGARGYEDSLGEKHESSVRRLLVGASETVGGALALSRTLSGRWLP